MADWHRSNITSGVHSRIADLEAEIARLRELHFNGHDHCPNCEYPFQQGERITALQNENYLLRKRAERWKKAAKYHNEWKPFSRFLLGKLNNAEAEIARLREALERIADTDPDEGTAWFHDIATKALEADDG